MFLSAIGVLLIAIIILTIVGVSRCKKDDRALDPSASASEEPAESAEPSLEPVESIEPSEEPTTDPNATVDPNATPDPNTTVDPNATPASGETSGPGAIVVNTPGAATSASPGTSASPSAAKYYTSPTTAMKNNSQKGYVNADKVNMRKEPNKNASLVKSKIEKNTAVTLYVEQDGWWFLKCGDKYGYIKADYISKGSAPTSAASSGEQTGKVIVSRIALRKSADSKSECIKEYEAGEAVTILKSEKGSDGKTWYYVKTSDGKKGYMYAEYVKVNKK